MRLVVTAGTGGASRGTLGKKGYYGPAIGKTGTTDQHKDLWFVGSTPYFSSALWLGYDIPDNLHASASDFAAPIWGWWMRKVHAGYDRDKEFEGLEFRRAGV
jgi:membrane peptidoglycan carboxypeptidase